MRVIVTASIAAVAVASVCQAATLKMPTAPELAVDGPAPRPMTVVLEVPDDLHEASHVVATSPFDRIRYPIGEYTVALLQTNLGRAFAGVEVVRGSSAAGAADAVVALEIVSFEAVIARPAYKPYTADVVYRLTVRDRGGQVVFAPTATGSAQTSKGMLSGFSARQLAAEAAARAMNDAVTQLLATLLEAEELAALEPPAATPERDEAAAGGGAP